MKTSSELSGKLFEEATPDAADERGGTIFSHGRAALMKGRAASSGTATGCVAVVKDKDDIARVKEGAVIVARTASPELVLGMTRACALATEQGGAGAMASGFARLYGIPAVVGVPDLIKALREGDLVRVDGTEGTVEIVVSLV